MKTKKITIKQVKKALEEVIDPEINISIIDLGLVYDVILNNNQVKIIMTLTTFGCPLYNLIENEIKEKLKNLGFENKDISIELTFDPPWSIEKMTPKGRALLGI